MSKLSIYLALGLLSFATASLADTSPLCPNESGYFYKNYRQRNPTQGGFVSDQAFVEDEDTDNVFISPTAAVCGSSSITGSVKIFGTAVINNATISGNVNIKDNAKVTGANISDNAIISGNAYINSSEVIIREKAQVLGNAKITGDAIIGGNAIIGGYARINTGNYTTEVIRPPAGKDDIPDTTNPEEVARRNYFAQMKSNLATIEDNFNKYDTSSTIQLLNLWEEYYTKVASPDINQLKYLLDQRKTADFSQISIIDSKIKQLNFEIGFLLVSGRTHFGVFLSRIYNMLEENKLRDTALRLENMRIRFYVYSTTYAGTFDPSRGKNQSATIEDAESVIVRSKYKDIVRNW